MMKLYCQDSETETRRTVKNHTLIASAANSATYTPPPADANPAPYEFALVALIVHPSELSLTLQSVRVVLPVCEDDVAVHLHSCISETA